MKKIDKQNFHLEAKWGYETATEMIQEFIKVGFSINAKEEGNTWIIDGKIDSEQNEEIKEKIDPVPISPTHGLEP